MIESLVAYWPHVAGLLTVLLTLLVSAHVVLSKRDNRAAFAWVGIICLVPVIGSVLYFVFGINRIQRRASVRRRRIASLSAAGDQGAPRVPEEGAPQGLGDLGLDDLRTLVARVTGVPLEEGNRVTPFFGGSEAYPAMLAAVDGAQSSVSLTTYIFNNDDVGNDFVDRLAAAVERGVQVHVLIDAAGARYSAHPVAPLLRSRGVSCATFMPTLFPWRFRYLNLRSHRKILVVDGRLGFTGGLNILEECARTDETRVEDLHFSVEGPVVAQLQRAFVEDWVFATGKTLAGAVWFPPLERLGGCEARGVPDGPDEDIDKLHWTLLGALAAARRSVRVVTPYFLPDATLCAALNVCAMRGVTVDIVLPAKSNLLLIGWATSDVLRSLGPAVRIWRTPPPFDHTKLMIVDETWTLLGSANWDARSLRLNFEFNIECYDAALAERMEELVATKIANARRMTAAMLTGRSTLTRLRDGVVGLLNPYL